MSDISQSTDSIREELENGNLDAPVSDAGATQTDIETGVDNSTTGSTVATNLDAKVSQAGQGVDWSSKTPKLDMVSVTSGGTFLSVSGSGYLTGVYIIAGTNGSEVDISIDGSKLMDWDSDGGTDHWIETGSTVYYFDLNGIYRFDSSLTIEEPRGFDGAGNIQYVLD